MPPRAAEAPGIAAGLSPLTAAFNVDGPPMRGISTGSGGTTSSGMRPDASNVAAPQLPVNVSTRASPSATLAFIWMFEKPGSRRGDRIRPFSTVTTRSGLIALSVPVSVPVSVTAPSPATGVSGGRYWVSVARLPRSSTATSPSPAASVSGSSPVTVSTDPLASTSRRSIASRSSAYSSADGLFTLNGRPFHEPANDSIVAFAMPFEGSTRSPDASTVARS